MSSHDKSALKRTTNFETFESRIVFSVDSVVADLALQGELDESNTPAQFSLGDAHESTGAEYVFNEYGFDGSGQTVAIIDSGIAWDHYALGGAYGEDARVVGGWDFAEGDANPYDDGPAGYHGTHVAGIVGSTDNVNRGVASGVDFVGLRVFDDQGNGNLEWVEQALQWVHDHKDDFANPITTVNLSLGVDWNADTIPGWATLEDEFAQLEADNIFISVAAGNAFKNYNSAGLAYPAVSDNVVPVASHDADGDFSDFSQRNERVLVAPGASIQSTVPGHLFGSSTSTGFLGASGTSMAAPYVAGASAVLREAMQFMGYQNVNQDTLYQHFRDTATRFYDSVTGGVYHRLDLGAAIDAVISDAHSSASSNATNLGTIFNDELVQGTIGKITDVDAFTFTAGKTGQLTIHLTESHDLDTVVRWNGQVIATNNNTIQLDVVAGQNYTFSLSTADGIGHYDLNMSLHETVAATDLGTLGSQLLNNQSVAGQNWYSLTASQEGILTVATSQAGVGVQIYDSSMNLLAQSGAGGGQLRADTWVHDGQKYFVRVTGNESGFDLQLNNQVSLINGILKVAGTQGNDNISVEHRADSGQLLVTVAQTNYRFSVQQVSHVSIQGAAGFDSLSLNLQGNSDNIFLIGQNTNLTTQDFTLASNHFESTSVTGDSSDKVVFLDSIGNDTFVTSGSDSSMSGTGFHNTTDGITSVHAVSRSGQDIAYLNGSQSADYFNVTQNHTYMQNADGKTVAAGFAKLVLDGKGGSDSLVVHGSNSADQFVLHGKQTTASLNDVNVVASEIEQSIVVSNDAYDSVLLKGTDGDDQLYSSVASSILTGNGYQNVALNTRLVVADVTGDAGTDTAWISDTAADDQLTGNHHMTRIVGGGHDRQAFGFDSVTVIAENGGADHAIFTGTRGNDTMFSEGSTTWVWGATYRIGMIGFEQVEVNGNGGNDAAFLRGNNDHTNFRVAQGTTEMSGSGYSVSARQFNTQHLDGRGGQNVVQLEGFDEDDYLTAEGSSLIAYLDEATIQAENFIWLEAETEENHSSTKEINAVDFWYETHGDWDDSE